MAKSARDIAREMPENPGVYLMKNSAGTIIYVGKAKNLRRRVNSYFLPNRNAKTAALVDKIADIDFVITGNEYEALVLENNLIKKHNPHYNILLKDGKSYPVIRITNEDFPRVFKTRRIIKDGSRYYGPYPDGQRLDQYLRLVEENFPLRHCQGVLRTKKTPCLYYHIHKCSGPCIGAVSKEEYGEHIRKIERFLSGDDSSIIKHIEKDMMVAAKAMDYETAAVKRDQLKALEVMQRNQMVEDYSDEDSRDYAAIEMRSYLCSIAIMQFRSGRLIGKALYRSECLGDETETLLSFLIQYYSDGDTLPSEIFVSCDIDHQLLSRYFTDELGKGIYVSVPKDGKHFRILRMAQENASRDVEKRLKEVDNTSGLESLMDSLGLESIPRHIEGFDIAQLSGKYTVASLIVFRDGNPSNKEYRHFSIKSLEGGIDDFMSMREAITRRYTRLMNENEEMPDLLMVDGGKGQVSAALDALGSLGLSFPVVGLAKEHEEIVFPDRPSLILDRSDEGLRVLIAVRDECHRFATSFNQRMRSKEASFSLLESIEGIGPERSKRIMRTFGSVDVLLELSAEEIAHQAGIPLAVAERIQHKLSF
ncbi:MAG: excinuclease ABC subunit UvrC [Candidatus Ornithospirochaeta sp.]|nr:excinuclease ABC subunit UvrC [Candidatus Ornithospirochaeta sp.]